MTAVLPYAVLSLAEPVVNGRIVMAAYAESLGGEPLTLFECRSGSLLLDNVEESGILSLRGYNDHVVEVLGAGTDKANATDINLFDDGSIVRTAG